MTPYELLTTQQNYAVIGVSEDPDKFASRIYRLLKAKGKTVYGINPKLTELAGEPIYNSILDIPESVDIAVMVVNPTIGIQYLEDIHTKKTPIVWLQPGTHSDELEQEALKLGLKPIQACVLQEYAKHEQGE